MRYLPLFSRQLWPAGITRRQYIFQGGVKDWIMSGSWSVNPGVTKKKVSLCLHAVEEIADASLHDALRMSGAAFESATSVSVYLAEPRSYAWQFISYYYAGYFAANALMRLSGYSSVNLSASECGEINQRSLLYGVGGTDDKNKIAVGQFYMYTDLSNTPSLEMAAVSSKGGVHIQFWTSFLRFLGVLRHCVVSSGLPKSDRDFAIAELDLLVANLKFSGVQTGAWLSEVRNGLNYRLDYGAWFPYDNCVSNGSTLKDAFKQASLGNIGLPTPSQNLSAPERASRVSASLLAWLKTSLVTLEATVSGEKKSSISKGVFGVMSRL